MSWILFYNSVQKGLTGAEAVFVASQLLAISSFRVPEIITFVIWKEQFGA